MKYETLILEKKEYVYLKRVLNILGYKQEQAMQQSLAKLTEQLQVAKVLDEHEMPSDIIRFNSFVTIKTETYEQLEIQLVIPSEDDFNNKKISVLKPMGAALIGYAENDEVSWDFPGGTKTIFIKAVKRNRYQQPINVPI